MMTHSNSFSHDNAMHNYSNRNKSIAVHALNSEILKNTQVTFAGISSDIPGLSAESINAFKRGLVGGWGPCLVRRGTNSVDYWILIRTFCLCSHLALVRDNYVYVGMQIFDFI